MIYVCPDCKGFEDRPYDLCAMCSDPGVAEEYCTHDRLEKYNEGCDCPGEPCPTCGAEMDTSGDGCWRCDDEGRETPMVVNGMTVGP